MEQGKYTHTHTHTHTHMHTHTLALFLTLISGIVLHNLQNFEASEIAKHVLCPIHARGLEIQVPDAD
jgi:hypothetical protein